MSELTELIKDFEWTGPDAEVYEIVWQEKLRNGRKVAAGRKPLTSTLSHDRP